MRNTKNLIEKCRMSMDFATKQLRHLVEAHHDYFPMYTIDGKWKHSHKAWTKWCDGFLGGQLWLLYKHNKDPYWREKAEHYSRLIEHRKSDRDVHDLGFLFWPTWKRWYDLTSDPAINNILIEAGHTLAFRFMDKGRYLCSFVANNSLFIDIMMNVGLIFYAAQQTQNDKLWKIANQHCLTTRRYLVRGDGSTAQEGIFNTQTGEFLHHDTHQGWRSDSTWARGQTWALFGFTTAFSFTQDPRYLKTAEDCANYYIKNTPSRGIPPNDWENPNPKYPYESSAAAIAACGLFKLSRSTGDSLRACVYREYAECILATLTDPEFLAINTPGWEGILKHGIYHQGKGLGVDESVVWGDYFFLNAISEVLQTKCHKPPH